MNRLSLLGITASPRQEGNSAFLLNCAIDEATKHAGESLAVKRFSFHAKKISPCVQCYACDGTRGECVIPDDFRELRDLWLEADIILYSVPVWHLSIPSQLKAFFDRLGQSLSKRFVRQQRGEQAIHLKVVGNIAQGMDIFSGQERALLDLMNHAVLQNCIPVSGETYIGVGGWARWSRDTDRIEKLANDGDPAAESSVAAAGILGRRCVELAAILKAGFLQMENLIRKEPAYRPILERLIQQGEIRSDAE